MQLLEALDCRLPSFLKSSLKISSFRAGHPKHSCSTCCVVWFTLAAFSALFSRHFTLTCRLGQGYTAHHGGPRAREQYHRFQESQHWIRVVRVVFSLGLANSMAVAATQGDSGLGRARLLFLSPGGGMVQTLGRQMLERTTLDLLKNKSWTVRFGVPQGKYRKVEVEEDEEGLRAIERLAEMFGSLASRHVVFVESASCNCSTISSQTVALSAVIV